ncbi:MAG: hypothetical protein WB420_20885 [Bradyrhizobium sp.]
MVGDQVHRVFRFAKFAVITAQGRRCEEQSDEAIHIFQAMDCFAALAMTDQHQSGFT